MSTRAQIGFYESEQAKMTDFTSLLYQHSDGYPDGVLPVLEPFVKKFMERRGYDEEYLPAWVIYKLIESHVKEMKKLAKQMGESHSTPKDGENCLSYGICNGFHCDIEYFYRVEKESIKVYKANIPWDDETINDSHFEMINQIPL